MIVAVSTIASADPGAEFTREYQAGIDAFRLGKLDEATAHLETAKKLEPKLPGPHRFLAAVANAKKDFATCIAETRVAIQLNPQSREIAETRKLHDECRTSAGKPAFHGAELGEGGAIAITSNVPGAAIKINKLGYGATPLLPRSIAVGPVEITVEKQGFHPAHASIEVLPGVVTDVDLELEPEPDATPNPNNPNNPNPANPPVAPTHGVIAIPANVTATIDGAAVAAGKVEREPGTYTVTLTAPAKDPWRRRVRLAAGQTVALAPTFTDTDARESKEHVGVALVSGGLALLAAGFACTLVAHSAAADAREIQRVESARDPSLPDSTSVEPMHTRADLDAARTKADRFGLISDLSLGAGLAAVGAGAIFLYLGAGESSEGPARFALSPTSTGAAVTGTFRW